MAAKTYKILILGSGNIAAHHVTEFAAIPECKIVACVDRIPGRAKAFAQAHGIARSFDELDKAVAWDGFDAAINCTPDGAHMATALAMVAAGKHVFCEKPLAPSYPDALAMTEAVEGAGLMNMVNLTYRNSPALQKARAMVDEGAIGTLRHVEASYRQSWLVSKAWGDWSTEERWLWRLSTKHGSTGVLGDVGIHILDFATYGANDDIVSVSGALATYPKAENDRIGDYTLDANDSVIVTTRLASGVIATVLATRYATGHANDLTLSLHGTKGALQVETDGKASSLKSCFGEDIDRNRWKKIELEPVRCNARRFADALISGENGDPSFRRAADIQRVIDAVFESDKRQRPVAVG